MIDKAELFDWQQSVVNAAVAQVKDHRKQCSPALCKAVDQYNERLKEAEDEDEDEDEFDDVRHLDDYDY